MYTQGRMSHPKCRDRLATLAGIPGGQQNPDARKKWNALADERAEKAHWCHAWRI